MAASVTILRDVALGRDKRCWEERHSSSGLRGDVFPMIRMQFSDGKREEV